MFAPVLESRVWGSRVRGHERVVQGFFEVGTSRACQFFVGLQVVSFKQLNPITSKPGAPNPSTN